MTGLFDKIGETKARMASNYFKPGHYIVRLDAVKVIQNRQKDDVFVAECTVVHVFDNDDGKGHKMGESASMAVKMKSDVALGSIKRLCMCALDVEEEKITKDVANMVISKKQPLAGIMCEVQNNNALSKNGTEYTNIGWQRVVKMSEYLTLIHEDEEIALRFFTEEEMQKRLAMEDE